MIILFSLIRDLFEEWGGNKAALRAHGWPIANKFNAVNVKKRLKLALLPTDRLLNYTHKKRAFRLMPVS